MAENIQAIIFDMGGVILRSIDYSPRSALAKKYGLTLKQLENLVFENETAKLAMLGKISEPQHWKTVCDLLQVPPEGRKAFEDDFWQGDRLDGELIDFLDSMRPKIKVALLSNAWTGARQSLLEKHACKDVFDVSIFSYEVGMAKPDPAIYRLILERLGVAASSSIFVDDNKQNIESAAALGIHAIRFLDPEQAIRDIRALL